MMKVYNFNAATKEYYGDSDAPIDFLKTQADQEIRFNLPASATYVAPPAVGVDEVAVFENDEWTLHETHVGKVVYDVSTREPKQILSRGPVPDGYTLTLPPKSYSSWGGSEWVTSELDGVLLEIPNKILDIKNAAEQEIIAGFSSNALGSIHQYQSTRDDQRNLMRAVFSNSDRPWRCVDSLGVDESRNHTAAQLMQVLQDSDLIIQAILDKAAVLKGQIKAATTFAKLESINW